MKIFLKPLSALWKRLTTPSPISISVQKMHMAYILEQNRQFETHMRRKVEKLESTPVADASNLEVFDNFYRWCLEEAGPHRRSDDKPLDATGELAIARDILQAVVNEGLTPVAGNGVAYVRRGTMELAQGEDG